MVYRFYIQNAKFLLVLLSLVLLAIISIKPLGNDEFFFMHHAWEYHKKNLSDIDFRSGYPLILTTTFLSYLYKISSINVFLFLKPFLSLIYFSLLLKYLKDKKSIAIFSLLFLMLLNRAIEIRPESLCTIIILLLISFNFDFQKKSIYIKLTLLMFIPFISARFGFVAAWIYLQSILISKENISPLHFIIPLGAFLLIYSNLIELPWETIKHLLKWEDIRESQSLMYKLNRIFGNSITYKLISFAVFINLLIDIFKYKRSVDFLFLFGLIMNIMYLIALDKVPYEYTFLPTAIYILWYLNHQQIKLPSLSKIPLLKELGIIILIGIFLSDVKTNRDQFKKIYNYYVSSKKINSIEDSLIDPNLFSYKQIETRNLICEKYQGYLTFASRYNFHPICLADIYYLSYTRGLVSEENVSKKISYHKTVKVTSSGPNSVYFYK